MMLKKRSDTMYEIITQDKFRELILNYIHKSTDSVLYGMDVIHPLLEKLKFEEAQILISGYGGLMNTLDVLSSNIDTVVKDRLTEENDNIVYFINEDGVPAKMLKDQFDKMMKTIQFDDEIEYLQMPPDKDEKMFG